MRFKNRILLVICMILTSVGFLFTNCGQAVTGRIQLLTEAENIRQQYADYDNQRWPALSSADNPNLVIAKQAGQTVPSTGEYFADEMTVIAVVNIKDLVGPLFVADSGTDFESNKISYDNYKFIIEKVVSRQNADQSAVYTTASLRTLIGASDYVVVAARFNKDEQVSIYINGQRLELSYRLNGVMVPFSYLLKSYQIHSAVDAIFVYNKVLSTGEINTISRMLSASHDLLVPFDESEPTAPIVPLTKFQLAKGVMQTNCFSCHAMWASYTEEQFYTGTDQLVSKGSLENSKIYYRLKGARVTAGEPQNMPSSGNALSASDLQLIEDWILSY